MDISKLFKFTVHNLKELNSNENTAFQNFSSLQFISNNGGRAFARNVFQNFSSLQFIKPINSAPEEAKNFKTFQVYSS